MKLEEAYNMSNEEKARFRTAILEIAEDKELNTPGHILRKLSIKGKVPVSFDQKNSMEFIIKTIKEYGGHFSQTNPGLMDYINKNFK